MKKQIAIGSMLGATLLAMTFVAGGATTTNNRPEDFPYALKFELGEGEFAPGDSITISAVHGTRDIITTNETYCVEGTYTLASREKADLAFFATVANSGSTPVEPRQTMRITKGTGTFRLIKNMRAEGYLHVSFYNGNGFGGVYFGQEPWVLHHKGWSYVDKMSSSSSASSGPNAAMFEYLGNPVPPPADMEAAYSKKGLTDAVQLAARNAGIVFKHIEIDDSEYPFIVGVVCQDDFQDGDWKKLQKQLRKLAGYQYSGGVGSRTCSAFNLVPWDKFPSSFQRVSHRLNLREQMLYERINAADVYPLRADVGQLKKKTPSTPESAVASKHNPVTASTIDPLLEPFGKPVPPPGNMDPAYSKNGLTEAVQLAAQNTGISLKRIEIDDSEYPFLVGVECQNGDWGKLKGKLNKLDGYEYFGTVGSDTCDVFALIPPGNLSPNYQRLILRQQMFYGKINK